MVLFRSNLFLLLFLGSLISNVYAQHFKQYKPMDAGEIKMALEKANTLGSALYLAAHPDDENTQLISYLTKHRHVRTGYLSITRGDGGQNLLGSEQGQLLGVLRTQELLSAREVDGGLQYFTRANDFGYSKTADETLQIWDSTSVLSDIVWVIRKFRPDVIITRFPSNGYGGHGHHTASAMLAETAFHAAADPEQFPGQLEYVDTWQPKRLLFNTSWWFYRGKDEKMDSSALLNTNIGLYNPLLGQSLTEIAAVSRSQHRSQGFGVEKSRGNELTFLRHTAGEKTTKDIFDGIDISWSRLEGGKAVETPIREVTATFDPDQPHKIIPHLVEAYKALENVKNEYWRTVKRKELKRLIAAANGLWFESTAGDHAAAPGTDVAITNTIVNRGPYDIRLKKIIYPFEQQQWSKEAYLPENKKMEWSDTIRIPEDAPYTHPYWLRNKMTSKGLYTVETQQLRGLPEAEPAVRTRFVFEVDGVELTFRKPVQYRWRDPAQGGQYRPFEIVPPVTVNIENKVYVFSGDQPKKIRMKIRAGRENAEGKLNIQLPGDWEAEPSEIPVTLEEKGAEITKTVTIHPPASGSVVQCTPQIVYKNRNYGKSLVRIQYDHIPIQTLFPEAQAKLVRLDIKTRGEKIGYISGSGDEIPTSLEQIGYEVVRLTPDNFDETNLSDLDAIVTGVRAYNTNKNLKHWHDELMQYVKQGGTMVAQYSKSFGLVTENIGPYPLQLSHDRVTVEEAEMKFLQPEHPLLNTPNKITQKDFEGWIQERGLYFPDEWDDKYVPLFSSHDPGEEPTRGSLLLAEYGEGAFIYTGLSFFRQLPHGNPGAYRLFANLVSYSP